MQTQMTCPNCGAVYVTEIDQVIDVGRQPQLKELLLSGRLNLAVCPNCGAGGRVATPMLYHDPAHDLFMVFVPPELNLDQIRREELIGRLAQQVIGRLPMEQRRGYLLQPQTMLTLQSFMERVWETEGVTPEMLAQQQRQVDLLRNLAGAAPDVQDYLLKENRRLIDETFFAILRAQIDALSQSDRNGQLINLLNLQAKLMTETEIGRSIEKRQMAIHAFNRDAQKQGGLTPQLLLSHIMANQDDDTVVNTLAVMGNAALTYEFFALMTGEIEKLEKRDPAAAARLTQVREQLLALQQEMQQATQQALQGARATLDAILAADDTEAATLEHMAQIDDAFMHVLEARLAHAEQSGRRDELARLLRIQDVLISQAQGTAPPEVELLSRLVSAPDAAERRRMLDEQPDLITPELMQVVEMLRDQARSAGQTDLVERLGEVQTDLRARLATA